MESDNSNLQNTSIRYLVNAYIFIFFFWGGGRGGLEEKPPVPQTDPAWVVCHDDFSSHFNDSVKCENAF